MSNVYRSVQSSTGTNTLTQTGAPNVTWNLTSLSVSFAGPSYGPNAKLTIYDGSTSGDVLYKIFLSQPQGSVGTVQDVPLPKDSAGKQGLQALPGNSMVIVVDGFGANQCSINARFTDGLS